MPSTKFMNPRKRGDVGETVFTLWKNGVPVVLGPQDRVFLCMASADGALKSRSMCSPMMGEPDPEGGFRNEPGPQ